ncbi:hypothetical protein FB451DRAFT_1376261 [Mycena latifolia]|nr:hypothetical protein FB451DRAFT_1376261 [Mycena latifolia]
MNGVRHPSSSQSPPKPPAPPFIPTISEISVIQVDNAMSRTPRLPIQHIPRPAKPDDTHPTVAHRLRRALNTRAVFPPLVLVPFLRESAAAACRAVRSHSKDGRMVKEESGRTAPEIVVCVDALDGAPLVVLVILPVARTCRGRARTLADVRAGGDTQARRLRQVRPARNEPGECEEAHIRVGYVRSTNSRTPVEADPSPLYAVWLRSAHSVWSAKRSEPPPFIGHMPQIGMGAVQRVDSANNAVPRTNFAPRVAFGRSCPLLHFLDIHPMIRSDVRALLELIRPIML